ncbi:hypothetical protein AB1I63_06750 [Streptococcus pneumoniae]
MTTAMGFVQASTLTVRIIGNLSGGLFLGFLSIEIFAFLNALTFLFAFGGLWLIRGKLI